MGKRVALITGATSGIGAAFARHFAKNGYDLIITGHPDDQIELNISELQQKFEINIELIPADLSDENNVEKIEEIIKSDHRIEVLINNAGFGLGMPFYKKNIDDLIKMVRVHINAPIRFVYAVLPGMVAKNRGIIIDVSSLSSMVIIARDPLYCATKVFHNSFLEALHVCMRNTGIKLQVLCPGLTKTNFHKKCGVQVPESMSKGIMPWMEPDEVVEISVRNLRRKNKVIVIPGLRNKMARLIFNLLPRNIGYWLSYHYLQ